MTIKMFLNSHYYYDSNVHIKNYMKSIHVNVCKKIKENLVNELIDMDFDKFNALKLLNKAIERRRNERKGVIVKKSVDDLIKEFVIT
jgi:hypothetical protein